MILKVKNNPYYGFNEIMMVGVGDISKSVSFTANFLNYEISPSITIIISSEALYIA